VRLNEAAEARLVADGEGRFYVEGDVIFVTVMRLLAESHALFADEQRIEVDLGRVGRINTAGLALIIEWLRRSRQEGRTFLIRRPPAALTALARICEAEEIISSSLAEDVAPAATPA
jgi:phospholipid transport system transporter-binding protein